MTRALGAILFAATLAACGPGAVVRHGVVDQTALASLQTEVTATRGLAFEGPVPSRALPPAGIRDVLIAELDHGFPAADLAVIEAVYARLNLIDAGTVLRPALQILYEGQVAAFYDPRRRELTIATDALDAGGVGLGIVQVLTGRDPVGEMLVSHELVHALQDQYWPMPTEPEPLTASESDRLIARRAVLEGDATLASFAVLQGGTLGAATRTKIVDELAPLPAQLAETYPDVPAIIRETLAFQYQAGTAFTARALADGGWKAVDRVEADPPTSTEQVLHPERYFDRRDDPSEVVLAGNGTLDRAGYRLVLADTLGELDILVLARRTLPAADAARIADGWDGDRLKAWQRGDDLLLAWMTVWDTEDDATEFAAAMPTMTPGARVEQRGTRVLVLVGPEVPGLAGSLLATSRVVTH
ncbi:MAG TPA: hypothetical protein VGR62_16440 [Candidatus Binatia bacterium]|jgi:hypothetical protein|nr:hypothetical protein [Candidatus Binatia bacterium]